jgi:hypothetical protein
MNRSGERSVPRYEKLKGKRSAQNRREFLADISALSAVFTFGNTFDLIPTRTSDGRNIFFHAPQNFITLPQPDKDGVFIITKGEHTPEEIASAIAEIQPVAFQPPSDRWSNLHRTVAALGKEGGKLKIAMLGDSIINDTYRSQWYDLLRAQYPKCEINAVAIVRGNTGCWWYKDDNRISHYVLPQEPDLLIIGGISQKNDIESIRQVIHQVQQKRPCDVLLLSEVLGETDPRDDSQWTFDIPLTPDNYRRRLLHLAYESRSGFFDMNAYWGDYIRSSEHPVEWYHRDPVHANIRGEQVIGHILAHFFMPPLPKD